MLRERIDCRFGTDETGSSLYFRKMAANGAAGVGGMWCMSNPSSLDAGSHSGQVQVKGVGKGAKRGKHRGRGSSIGGIKSELSQW